MERRALPLIFVLVGIALVGCSSSSPPNVGAACGFSGDNACVGGTQCIIRPDARVLDHVRFRRGLHTARCRRLLARMQLTSHG
jgi:hypothetical protein